MDPLLRGDARITAERGERKYAIARDRVQRFAAAMNRVLGRHHHGGADHLPGVHHFVTTIYFDTPQRDVYRAADDSDRHLKVRAKEYYDLHPSLAAVATDPRDLVRYQPVLWLEIKEQGGVVTAKRRVALLKLQAAAFLADGAVTDAMRALQEDPGAFEALNQACRGFGGPLAADCLVNYRRLAWQDATSQVRVTLDVGLAYFGPPPDLWTRRHALVREALGAPAAEEPLGIVEVKTLVDPPAELATVLADLGAREIAFSKFAQASRAVHG